MYKNRSDSLAYDTKRIRPRRDWSAVSIAQHSTVEKRTEEYFGIGIVFNALRTFCIRLGSQVLRKT